MKVLLQKYITVLILFVGSISFTNAQQKQILAPVDNSAEQTLKKLLAIALNPKDNGLSMVDTTSRYYLSSSVKYPASTRNYLTERSTVYQNGLAHVSYKWTSDIAQLKSSDTITSNKTLGKLQETIARALPKVRDSFYVDNSYGSKMVWEWKPKKDVKLQINYVLGKSPTDPLHITLNLSVKKTLTQDQNKIADSLINKYTKQTLASTSTKEAGIQFVSLLKILNSEGLSHSNIIAKVKPPFKSIASQNIDFASEIVITSPTDTWQLLKAELNAEQIASFQKYAKKISDDFEAKYNGKKTQQNQVATAPAKPQKQIFNDYFTNDPNPSFTSKYIFVLSKEISGQYIIREVDLNRKGGYNKKWSLSRRGLDKTVDESYFNAAGGKWKAVSIGDCVVCYGTGIEVTKTPYTYYREEKGIYNKYTYSGSGYNTTSKVCTMCKGEGFSIYKLQ